GDGAGERKVRLALLTANVNSSLEQSDGPVVIVVGAMQVQRSSAALGRHAPRTNHHEHLVYPVCRESELDGFLCPAHGLCVEPLDGELVGAPSRGEPRRLVLV